MSMIAPLAIIPIITNWESVWLPLCILAVMTAVGIYNLLLMIGRAFGMKELENYAKSELLQAAANGFMAIFFVLILGGALEVAGSLIQGQIACGSETINIENTPDAGIENQVMNDAYTAIQCKLQEKALALAEAQEDLLTDAETKTAFFILNMQLSTFGMTFFKGDWVTSTYQYVEKLRVVNNLITNLLIQLNTQQELITYIKNNMLGIFLPMGLLLRSFYFTRGPGALMMALGIGLYYVFPVFYVLLDPGFIALPEDSGSGEWDDPTMYCYPTMSSAVSVLNSVNSGETGMASSGLDLGNIEEELASIYSQVVLHPLIAFFLTMVFVRYFMVVLGADSSDLTKMFTKVV